MAFEFKSFEHFKQMRIKAAQWRAFDKQLKGAEGEQLIRGVLQEPVIDNRTDQTYEKRLYEGFKEGMRRLREGIPLANNEPPVPPKDQFREACRSLGYLPSSPRASPSSRHSSPSRAPRQRHSSPPRQRLSSPPRQRHSSPPRQRHSSPPRASPPLSPPSPWSPPIPLLYPSTMFQRTPSLSSSPSSSVLLKATPPYQQFPSPIKTPTRVFSPSVSALSRSPTPPPTPHVPYCPAYSEYSSSDESIWSPSSPPPTRQDLESASFQLAVAEEIQKQPAPEKPAPEKPAPEKQSAPKKQSTPKKSPPKRKRRKQQLKFSDEALKKVRPSPPATRRSKI